MFVALSSVVAVHGNLGQANYACANRAMSALLDVWDREHPHIRCLSLMLPPIDGAGMAMDHDLRELMLRKGWGADTFLHIDELTHLFCQEVFVPAATKNTVLLAKSLPARTTSQILFEEPCHAADILYTPAMKFPKKEFPLIDVVEEFDPLASVIQVRRAFLPEKDLWLPDHKPFKFIRHPLVAAIMAIEAFMETAELLFPYLRVYRLENIIFEQMIECPPDIERTVVINCRCNLRRGKEIHCRASLGVNDTNSDRRGQLRPNFKADLILSGPGCQIRPPDAVSGITPEELDAAPKSAAHMSQWYRQATDFKGRYLLLSGLDGYGPGLIKGKAVYPVEADFDGLASNPYRYSAYALEAVLHLVAFYHSETDAGSKGFLIPLQIGELVFQGGAIGGDKMDLEARRIEENTNGASWNAKCLKSDGAAILNVRGIRMHRIYE